MNDMLIVRIPDYYSIYVQIDLYKYVFNHFIFSYLFVLTSYKSIYLTKFRLYPNIII